MSKTSLWYEGELLQGSKDIPHGRGRIIVQNEKGHPDYVSTYDGWFVGGQINGYGSMIGFLAFSFNSASLQFTSLYQYRAGFSQDFIESLNGFLF